MLVSPNSSQMKDPQILRLGVISCLNMAEREGFEPSIRLTVYRFSRPAHSSALPPLLTQARIYLFGVVFKFVVYKAYRNKRVNTGFVIDV